MGEVWPVPRRVLTSGRAAVDSAPHGPSAQPGSGKASRAERPIHLSTVLTLGGAGGREVAEGCQSFQAVMENPVTGVPVGCQKSIRV